MSAIQVKETCTGCGICVKACPFGAIVIVEGKAQIGDSCTLCTICTRICPQHAITIERPLVSTEQFREYRGVWVVAETAEGSLRSVSLELLGEGGRLAKTLGEELSAVLIGSEVTKLAKPLAAHGAEKIFLVEHELLKHYVTDIYTDILSSLIVRYKPSIVLIGATINGRDLAPRVAARLRIGLTADCTGLEIDGESRLIQIRPAFGGNIMASIISQTRPQMATVRPRVMKTPKPDESREPQIERVEVNLNPVATRAKVLERVKQLSKASEKIEEAHIIVSCGKGIGRQEDLKLAYALAEALGGAVGSSRPLVDCGWLPHHQQVGQSGKTVSPRLYIALGISGSIQHRIGMQSSEMIIAVNKDPEAPIFSIADLGIVGDIFQIVPKLTEQLRGLNKPSNQH
jgi:electron transfer flavoprotein alpha subunit